MVNISNDINLSTLRKEDVRIIIGNFSSVTEEQSLDNLEIDLESINFVKIAKQELNKIENKSIRNNLESKLVTWYKEFKDSEDIVIISNTLKKHELLMSSLLGKIGYNINVYTDRIKDVQNIIKDNNITEISIETKEKSNEMINEIISNKDKLKELTKNNSKLGIEKVNTIAYDATKEIEHEMYDGSIVGMFKSQEYREFKTPRLYTTFGELKEYIIKPNTLRPNFGDTETEAVRPTIFTLVKGVGYRKDLVEYCKFMEALKVLSRTDKVCLIDKYDISDYCKNISYVCKTKESILNDLIKNKKINIDKIVKSQYYKYSEFNPITQRLIIEKAEALMKIYDERLVLCILLGLDKHVLKYLRANVFKCDMLNEERNSKLSIIVKAENLPVEIRAYLAYISLIGVDVIILTKKENPHFYTNENKEELSINEIDLGNYDCTQEEYSMAQEIAENDGKKNSSFLIKAMSKLME